MIAADSLAAVDMAERRIIKLRKRRRIHLLDRADTLGPPRLRARQRRVLPARCHKLMGDEHIALLCIHLCPGQSAAHGRVIGRCIQIFMEIAHTGSLDKRQEPEMHRPVLIFRIKVRNRPIICAGDIYAASGQQRTGKIKPYIRIMIAADRKNAHTALCQRTQKIIHKSNRFLRRDILIVKIAGQKHRIQLPLPGQPDNLAEHIALIFNHTHIIHALAKMKIAKMKKFHSCLRYCKIRTYVLLCHFSILQ